MLRSTLLGSLLDAARHNLSRGATEIAIFESGTVYRAAAGPPDRRRRPATGGRAHGGGTARARVDERHAARDGPLDRAARGGTPRPGRPADRAPRAPLLAPARAGEADFFAGKALLEAVLEELRVEWSLEPAPWPFLHPGRSATIRGSAAELGFVGELHPLLAARWDLQRSAVFELDLDLVVRASPLTTRFLPFPATPPIRRDLAVTLPEALPAERALETIRDAAGELLDQALVFDVYSGEQVGPDRRSLAIALTFQAPDRTLTEEEIAPLLGADRRRAGRDRR